MEVPARAVLGRVAAAAGPGVSLTHISITPDGKITIQGQTSGVSSMQSFAERLTEGRAILRAIPESWKQDEKGQITFRVAASFRAPRKPGTGG